MDKLKVWLKQRNVLAWLAVVIFLSTFIALFWAEIVELKVISFPFLIFLVTLYYLWGQYLKLLIINGVTFAVVFSVILAFDPSALTLAFVIWSALLARDAQPLTLLLRFLPSAIYFFYALASFLTIFYISLRLMTRFVLPTQTRKERKDVLSRLWLYIRGKHGRAIFVENGVSRESEADRKRKGPGIALVDSASALALEKDLPPFQNLPPAHLAWRSTSAQTLWRLEKESRRQKNEILVELLRLIRWLRVMPSRWLRRLLLFIHLFRSRKPHRLKPVARVEGPGIVLVAADELVRDTLDLRRQTRIRRNIRGVTRDGIEVSTFIIVTFQLEPGPAPTRDAERNHPAYRFNAQSGFRAVYGTPVAPAPNAAEDEMVKHWTDLPAYVASDIFRDLISTQTYDNLFRPSADGELPLNDFRTAFADRVRSERVLRERGIFILFAGFTRLFPNELVVNQRIDNWRAPWRLRAVETLAAGDLETMRIIHRQRVDAQKAIMDGLVGIIRDTTRSKAAVVLHLFKSLEAASADPSVRRLVAGNTLEVLSTWTGNLRSWLGTDQTNGGVNA